MRTRMLDETDELTEGERAAVAAEPRAGIAYCAGPDYRLSQDETELLIVRELHRMAAPADRATLSALTHRPRSVTIGRRDLRSGVSTEVEVLAQRGGISTDEMLRLLAFRMLGRRDLDWQETDLERIARHLNVDELRLRDGVGGTELQGIRASTSAAFWLPEPLPIDEPSRSEKLIAYAQLIAASLDRDGIESERFRQYEVYE